MTLPSGSKLGPNEILGQIGAGGAFPLSTRSRGERAGVRGA